jgi:hypothetical protein
MFDKVFVVEDHKTESNYLCEHLACAMPKNKITLIKKIDEAYQMISNSVEGTDHRYAAFIDIYWQREPTGIVLAKNLRKKIPFVRLVAYTRLDASHYEEILRHFDAWIDKQPTRPHPYARTLAEIDADFLEQLASRPESFFSAVEEEVSSEELGQAVHNYFFPLAKSEKVKAQFLVADFSNFSLKDDDLQLSRFQKLQDSVSASLQHEKFGDEVIVVVLPTGDGVAIGIAGSDTEPHALRMAFQLLEHLRPHGLEIELGIGVHYGPVYLLEGPKGEAQLIGPGLNKATRVQSAGKPGTILVSDEYFSMFMDRSGHPYCRALSKETKSTEYQIKKEPVFRARFCWQGDVGAPSNNLIGGKDIQMSDDGRKVDVGDDSVVMGNISGCVGHRSVVIGPTDDRGNTILNQSMAVGHNAHAGQGSIAIGANAGAGSEIGVVFAEIGKIIEATGDQALISAFSGLCLALNSPQKDKSTITRLWDTIKTSAALNGSIELVLKATKWIATL